ncbi:hypothetical protein ACFVYF_20160 [Streptomyces sp. NPDC058274]|uniref:hypothetical protein n=1 Tax=Streptomyces sp. NPDC058274 TaxID=3346416 RepID=UPI0036EBD9A1
MTTPDFRPTHVVPQEGLPAWETPDPSHPTVSLDALLPVELVDRRGDWGRVLCANGWSAWVDGRLLIAVPQAPPAATSPLTRTADPRPLLARAEEAIARYRGATEDLTVGRLDGEQFHDRTRGLRAGVVVDGESVWLYDAEHERWVYCDGTRLNTYAAPGEPSPGIRPPAPSQPHREATRVVREPEKPEKPEKPENEDATGRVRDSARRPEPEPEPEPEEDATRVVRGPNDAEATRVVPNPENTDEETDENTDADATRLVPEPEPEPEPEEGEATRVVRESAPVDGHEPTRLVPHVPDAPMRPGDVRPGDA